MMTATTINAIPTEGTSNLIATTATTPAPEAVVSPMHPNVNTIVTQHANIVNPSKNAEEVTQDVAVSEEELTKLEAAATKIQSVYRGYQSRQELYGPALTTTQKWRHLIDFSRTAHIHKLHAEGSHNDNGQDESLAKSENGLNESKARRAWRRAEFLGSRLGKGSNGVSAEESLVL
ncbi:hypothetical protein BGX26_012853, partial [Mortierella sp. AD094]